MDRLDKEKLRKQAEYYKQMYLTGYITKDIAIPMIEPYLNLVNRDCQNIAKAYGRYFSPKTFEDFIKNS